jgi:hypothetical protein
MNHQESRKTRTKPVGKMEVDRLEASAKNRGRLVDPDQASCGGARLGLGHVTHSKHRGYDVVRLEIEDMARLA